MTDIGHGYYKGIGMYVVPTSGVYVFTWSTTGNTLSSNDQTTLVINGSYKDGSIADGTPSGFQTATGLIVTSVNAGDHVYIRANNAAYIRSGVSDKSTFSGWRLF